MSHASQNQPAKSDGGTELAIESETEESTTQTLLRSIAALRGVDETELAPLYEHVDTAALQNLLRHAEKRDALVSVRFTVEGYTVSVRSDDRVEIVNGP